MVSKLLLYPFIIMVFLDIYSIGLTQSTYGSSGSFYAQQNNATSGTQTQVCNLPSPLPFTNPCAGLIGKKALSGNGWFSLTANPFTDPIGFIGTIGIVLGIVVLGSVALFGTSVLNAATAYILFISVALLITWSALLNAGSAVFLSFPCYSTVTQQIVYTCPSSSLPFANGDVLIGNMFATIMSLAVFLGVIDTVAI